MCFDYRLADRQSGTARSVASGPERCQHAVALERQEPWALVRYRDFHEVASTASVHPQRGSLRCVAHGVLQQIGEDLVQLRVVGVCQGQAWGELDLELHLA